MVYFTTAIAALYYLLMTPVRVGVVYRSDRQQPLRLGVLVGLIRWQPPLPQLGASKKRAFSGFARRIFLRAARRAQVERLMLDVTISSQDAATTALVSGLLQAIAQTVRCAWPDFPLQARIRTDFHGASQVQAAGIVSMKLGHIIRAGSILLAEEAGFNKH